MKLVEILARELKEWPSECEGIFQDYDGELRFRGCSPTRSGIYASRLATDCVRQRNDIGYSGKVVTHSEWKAELARLHSELSAKPAKKSGADKDGWQRARGRKPNYKELPARKMQVRHRDKSITEGWTTHSWNWDHEEIISDADIMAFRIENVAGIPAEQPAIKPAVVANAQAFNERAELRYDPCASGPLQWRDRITEIDRTVEALEEERASLVQRLEAEGFRLIERVQQPVEDMSDWRNWNEGDLVKCVSFKGKGFARLTIGKLYEYDGKGCIVDDDGDSQGLPVIEGTALQFHSRPYK